ncbi:MAG: hypothetical protein WAK86_17135 [Pseudonocardiaceae bacterium]
MTDVPEHHGGQLGVCVGDPRPLGGGQLRDVVRVLRRRKPPTAVNPAKRWNCGSALV